MVYIILLGAPGSGKGTQAAELAKEFRLTHLSTGDLFRQAVEKQTELGKQALPYMKKGTLVPDDITIKMVMERLSDLESGKGVILDGFPRNLAQARKLDAEFNRKGKNIDKVVYLKVSQDELLKRLGGRWVCRNCQSPHSLLGSPVDMAAQCGKCGGELYQRPDDTDEAVKKRLSVYFTETSALIDYYQSRGKLSEVNGEGSVEEVSKRISAVLNREMVKN